MPDQAAPMQPPMERQGHVWSRLSLGAKFTIIVSIILVAAMAANTLYSLTTASRFHEQQLTERARALGRLISLLSPDPILGFDFLRLNDYTREVSSQPDIVYGVIVNPKGAPISAYVNASDPLVRALGEDAAKNVTQLLKSLEGHADLLPLKFPIVHNNTELGQFLVGASRASIKLQFQHQLIVQIVMLALLVIFLSAAIHLVFRRNVLQPINKLISASDNVGHGQYTLVEVKSADEMGKLSHAFNDMARNVEREDRKSTRLNSSHVSESRMPSSA